MRFRRILFILIGGPLLIMATANAQNTTDAHEILNCYLTALGGVERLLAERSSYSEGTISLGGMEGVVKLRKQRPGLKRDELALGPLNIIQGDNGEYAWVLDENGKLQAITNPDEAAKARRKVRNLMDEYAHADRASDVFAVAFQGIDSVNGEECYVIKIGSNLNLDSYTYFIGTSNCLLHKAVIIEGVESRDVLYADYREVDGLLIPFRTNEIPYQTNQSQLTQLTHYVSNPEIERSLFEPPQQGPKDYRFTEGDRAENVPFRFIGNHVYITVTVGGKERIWALDTGAGMTVLNRAFADELGLETQGELKGKDAGGAVAASFATLPAYSIKGIQFEPQTVSVIDMSELIRILGVDMVGVLGYDFLSRFVTKIDFANEMLSFYEPEVFQYTGDGHVVDMHISNSLFSVEAALDGIHAGNWIFDLGSSGTHLDGHYALREGYAARKGVVGLGHGAGNAYQLKDVRCDSIQFAGFTVYEPTISFSYGGNDTTFTADNIGVLGNSLFRHFVVYCDYARERLILEPGEMFNQSWPEDHSGLGVAWNLNRQIEVISVEASTPAEQAGFASGDLLRSINGIPVDLMGGIIAIRELLRSSPGSTYEFVIERAGRPKEIRLRLAELL